MKKPPSKTFTWRLPTMCTDCPFASSGPGLHLRKSLQPGRFAGILAGLRRGEHFFCHKTTAETGDGSNLVCAGALAYLKTHGIASAYVRLCESFEGVQESKREIFRRLTSITKRRTTK